MLIAGFPAIFSVFFPEAHEGKVRLNRGGNRTIDTALHMIAVTQSRGVGPGRAYLDKLSAADKTRTEAL